MEIRTDDQRGTVIDFVDEVGVRHVIPWTVGSIGLQVLERYRDPFDPGWFPSEADVAEAYIAMARALRSEYPQPTPPTHHNGRDSKASSRP